jgi:hypothetical protein
LESILKDMTKQEQLIEKQRELISVYAAYSDYGNRYTRAKEKDEPKMSADKSSFIVTTADRIDGILGSNPNSIHPDRIEGYQFRECIRLLAKQVDILFERNNQFKQ